MIRELKELLSVKGEKMKLAVWPARMRMSLKLLLRVQSLV